MRGLLISAGAFVGIWFLMTASKAKAQASSTPTPKASHIAGSSDHPGTTMYDLPVRPGTTDVPNLNLTPGSPSDTSDSDFVDYLGIGVGAHSTPDTALSPAESGML